jgi:hypothetical protein
MESVGSVEDLFSTIDFKNFVLHQRIGITETNSQYIEMNQLSRAKLAADFILDVQNNHLKLEDFDDETIDNFNRLIRMLDKVLT